MTTKAGSFTIGHLARQTGTKVHTIRYYERAGLLAEPPRTEGNQRLYNEAAMRRLRFIRHARELGFTLEAVRELLSLADHPERACADADRIAERQLEEVDYRISRLQSLRAELAHMVTQCQGGQVGECHVIGTLADHSLCITDHGTADPDQAAE